MAERTVEPIEVTIGSETRTIDVKRGWLDGKVYTCKPEFEQVQTWAREASACRCGRSPERWGTPPAVRPREREPMSTDRLSSGSEALDRLLGGGYEHRVITQLYGEAATGKSTIAVLATAQALRTGKSVVYIDTEGFSAERFRQIAGDEATTLVEKLFLYEPLDLAEQGVMIANAEAILRSKPAALVVVDSATALYRQEDLDDNEALRLLTRQMLHLLGLARRHDLPVLVTNQVYMDPGKNRVVGLGGTALEHISKAIVRLEAQRATAGSAGKTPLATRGSAVRIRDHSDRNPRGLGDRVLDLGHQLLLARSFPVRSGRVRGQARSTRARWPAPQRRPLRGPTRSPGTAQCRERRPRERRGGCGSSRAGFSTSTRPATGSATSRSASFSRYSLSW